MASGIQEPAGRSRAASEMSFSGLSKENEGYEISYSSSPNEVGITDDEASRNGDCVRGTYDGILETMTCKTRYSATTNYRASGGCMNIDPVSS